MHPETLAELVALKAEMKARADKRSPASFIPHDPTPKQREFIELDCFEALYGGAAGGGKSDALLMAALQYAHVAGYAALILRRTYADLSLPGAIMDRSHQWLAGTSATWNGTDKRWQFPSGATLSFGYLDNERDRYRYQGAELQFIAFDELTQFPEQWYRYLLSRLRKRNGVLVPLRARAASNPGGIGHDWVRRRFVETSTQTERRFIPANLSDNPHLDAAAYRRSLEQLPATERAQLLEGRWVRDSGGLVYRFDETRNTTTVAAGNGWSYILGIDYGYTDSTAFAVIGWQPNDATVYVVESFKREGLTPGDAAELAHMLEQRYRFERIVGDMGGLGKGYAEEARRRYSLPIEPADKNNKRGYIDLLNGDLTTGRIKLMTGNDALVAEWAELPWDQERKSPCEGFDDHIADAVLYAWRAAYAYTEKPAVVKPALGTREALEREADEMLERRMSELNRRQSSDWWDTEQ